MADLFPADVAGIAGQLKSYTGQEYVDTLSGGNEEAAQTLEDQFALYGATTDDISVGTGDYYGDDTYVRVNAIRVAGADTSTFLDQFVQNTIDGVPEFNPGMSATSEDATIGGKPVKVVTTKLGGSVYDVQYIYGPGDTIFTVVGGDDALIEELLSKLP